MKIKQELMYDLVIIGGGIVGLATAFKLKCKNSKLKIAILEKENKLAVHQTGHNSGVIHSGLYYKPGSFKAKNCLNGYHALIEFCEQEEIPFDICGKIVVATNKNQLPALQNLYERGKQNGLKKLRLINASELKEIEPHVKGIQGIHVPQTGIIDYKIVAEKCAEKFQLLGGNIFLENKVEEIVRTSNSLEITTNKQNLSAKKIINCAGLQSDLIARLTGIKINYKIIPFRGEYYKLKKEKEYLVKHLIYPVPNPDFPFLGVHFTRMAQGGVEAGPNAVLAFRREGYKKSDIKLGELIEFLTYPGFRKLAVKYWKIGLGEIYRSLSKKAFSKALQELIPEIKENDLVTGGSGVRAQACDKDGGLIDDFLVTEGERFINVGNAPSPAATASLAIGEQIAQLALKKYN